MAHELERSEYLPPDTGPLLLSGPVEMFSLRTSMGVAGRSARPAAEVPWDSQVVHGLGLLPVRREWRYGDGLGDPKVEWRSVGPTDGVFSSSGRTEEWRIPVRVILRSARDPEAQAFKQRFRTRVQELGAHKGSMPRGWAHLRDAEVNAPGWDPFPGLDVANELTESEPDSSLDFLELSEEEKPRFRMTRLPFTLRLDDDVAVLNPDALETLTFVLPEAQLAHVATLAREMTLSGQLHARMRVGGPAVELDVLKIRGFELTVADDAETRRKRLEWETAEALREARLTWEPELPAVRSWRESELHTALRECLPSLARRSMLEGWSEERRRAVFRAFVRGVKDWRLHDRLLRGADSTGDLPDSAKMELGCRGIDPYSFVLLGGPAKDYLHVELAGDARGVEVGSTLFIRRMLHALLTAETGAYLHEMDWPSLTGTPHRPDLLACTLRPSRPEYLESPTVKKWLAERDSLAGTQSTWHVLSVLGLAAIIGALAAAAGYASGSLSVVLLMGTLGLILGGWLGKRAYRDMTEPSLARRLAAAMQEAVSRSSFDENPFSEVEAAMKRAARMGAAWPADAWRLVRSGRALEADRLTRVTPRADSVGEDLEWL